ncbi:hypothetical protein TNCV_1602411 [Trichonephila clavipes]|nr:hypothetical protein TNCV_1602411 [Trichonephila clavipes]
MTHFEAILLATDDERCKFDPRSSDEDNTFTGSPFSRNFHTSNDRVFSSRCSFALLRPLGARKTVWSRGTFFVEIRNELALDGGYVGVVDDNDDFIQYDLQAWVIHRLRTKITEAIAPTALHQAHLQEYREDST